MDINNFDIIELECGHFALIDTQRPDHWICKFSINSKFLPDDTQDLIGLTTRRKLGKILLFSGIKGLLKALKQMGLKPLTDEQDQALDDFSEANTFDHAQNVLKLH